MTWLDAFYVPYLLVLLALPLLVRWRWGVIPSLLVTVAELGLVALVFYVLDANRMLNDPFVGKPIPREPFEVLRRAWDRHAVAIFDLAVWAILPAIAAIVGGALSLVRINARETTST